LPSCRAPSNSIGDPPFLPGLLDQIPADRRIASVRGDGACDTKDCHEAIALRALYARIPLHKNAKFWKTNRCGADACDVILHTMRRLDRAIRKNGAATTAAALLK